MSRMCEKYGWTPQEYLDQDEEIISYFEYIAQLENKK